MIMAPVFCKGVSVTSNITSLTAAERRVKPVSTASFAPGQHLFSSKADFTQCQYLGKVTSVAAGYVYFQVPAPQAYPGGGKVFVPAEKWQAASVAGTGGMATDRDSGIETLKTTGSELLHSRTSDARDFVDIIIRDVDWTDFRDYKAFVKDKIADGLGRFVAAYRDEDLGGIRVDLVKMRNPGEALRAKSNVRVLRSWGLGIQILSRNYYGVS